MLFSTKLPYIYICAGTEALYIRKKGEQVTQQAVDFFFLVKVSALQAEEYIF